MIQQWWRYKIDTAAAPAEDRRRSAADSEDWSLRPAGQAHPAEPRHSPVRRGTQGKHGWLGRRQWRRLRAGLGGPPTKLLRCRVLFTHNKPLYIG